MKIIVYDDNPDFGGHQVMSVLGVQAIAADPAHQVVFLLHPDNRGLKARLDLAGNIQLADTPCMTRRLQGIRSRINRRGIKTLCRLLQSHQADLLLCIQGDIEQSSQALIAAHRIGLECVSYLALPHTMRSMGARMGRLRDRINQPMIQLPDRYITISSGMADMLRARGASQPITVVPNGIAAPRISGSAQQKQGFVLGMLGRIELKQKRQDFVVRAFAEHRQVFEACSLLIAGSGPDRNALQQLIDAHPFHSRIQLVAWQQDPEIFYAGIDMLAVPSRYEGVPLVMLEALARRIPVIASNRDGMQEILPADWTFDPDDTASFVSTFNRVSTTWHDSIDALRERVMHEHSLERFNRNFVRAVVDGESDA